VVDEYAPLIKNRENAAKIKDFGSLRWGKISPTDIDGFIEIGNEKFIFIECKYKDSELPTGQRIALERLVDVVGNQKKAILVIASHDGKGDIMVGDCIATKYRYKKKWRDTNLPVSTLCDKFIES